MSNPERRDFTKFLHNLAESETYSLHISHQLNFELRATVGARINGPVFLRFVQERREDISSVLAAELFPDSIPPKLLIAEKEIETHNDLREKHPSPEARVSGEILQCKHLEFRLFSMDSILLSTNSIKSSTRTKLPEIIEWLISQEIIPVDATCQIILPENL